MGAVRKPRYSPEVLEIILDVANDLSKAHGRLLDLTTLLYSQAPPQHGIEGYGDQIHVMHYLLPLRAQVLRWLQAGVAIGAITDGTASSLAVEEYNQDAHTVERLLHEL